MYSLYGFAESVRNVYLVSHPCIGDATIKGTDDLRAPYLDFLSGYHPGAPINRDPDLFIDDGEVEKKLAAAYAGSTLNDLQQEWIIGDAYDIARKSSKLALARDALVDLLGREPTLNATFNLVIHSIFVTSTNITSGGYGSHGGSASGAIGAIWLSMQDSITKTDIMELFVHELTHHLVFIDELVHGHFNYDEILFERNFAFSAILNKIRPLDKVIHSIVVATEIILARRTFLSDGGTAVVHPHSEKMIGDVLQACESVYALKNLDDLITPRSRELTERCRVMCASLLAEASLGAAS